jgi:hypothetical protein
VQVVDADGIFNAGLHGELMHEIAGANGMRDTALPVVEADSVRRVGADRNVQAQAVVEKGVRAITVERARTTNVV